jgi:hypothetical protein
MTATAETEPEDEAYAPPPRRTRTRPRKSETDLVLECMTLIDGLDGGHCRKVHGGAMGNVGEPDLDIVLHGRAAKLEAKRPESSEKPSAAQIGAMLRWRKAGALVGWFRSAQQMFDILDHSADLLFHVDLDHPGCVCPRHGNGVV